MKDLLIGQKVSGKIWGTDFIYTGTIQEIRILKDEIQVIIKTENQSLVTLKEENVEPVKEFKYTPGSWKYVPFINSDDRFKIINSEGEEIAHVYGRMASLIDAINDASLISAAPDLYEAAVWCKDVLDNYPELKSKPVVIALNKAITKAERKEEK